MNEIKPTSSIGIPKPLVDGPEKVTGKARYSADFIPSDCLVGRIFRSPVSHAEIMEVDISDALSLPGVKAVITGTDLPETGDAIVDLGEGPARLKYMADNVLATDKVLYSGHPVAAVCADADLALNFALGQSRIFL